MSHFKIFFAVTIALLLSFGLAANNQSQDSVKLSLADEVSRYLKPTASINVKIKVEAIEEKRNDVAIIFCNAMSDYYFRDSTVERLYSIAEKYFPGKKISLFANGSAIEDLASKFYTSKGYKVDKKSRKNNLKGISDESFPLVKRISDPYTPTKGLKNRYIAMWQSHGFYYDQPLQRWEWQRARIF